jgi:hypothetical protein
MMRLGGWLAGLFVRHTIGSTERLGDDISYCVMRIRRKQRNK